MPIQHLNPFIYSRPLPPDQIIDRDGETEELLGHMLGGHFVRLYAPRKYGKTSLLKRALRDGADQGLTPVLVDLYRVSSLADVAVRFERAYSKHLKGSVRARVEEFLQKTGIGLSLGAYGISAKLQIDPRFDPMPAIHTLLDLPLRFGNSGGGRVFIALDEFQDVEKIPDLDGLMRSHIQHQGEVASYVFAGSEPALMKQLFQNKDRPLYGSALPMRLGRLANSDIAEYIVERFKKSGRQMGDALNPMLDCAGGHPQRVMLLAHRLWNETPEGEIASFDVWQRAYTGALDELNPEFDAQWRGLNSSEQKTMRAVITGHGSPYKENVLRRLEVTSDMVRRALPRLAGRAEIESVGDRYVVVDPLFAQWIERINEPLTERAIEV